MDRVLATGATGQLGRAVVDALAKEGVNVKAAARNPAVLSKTEFIEPVEFDFEDPMTHRAALDGVLGVFLVAPPLDFDAPAKLIPFIDSAVNSDVAYILFISALGVDASEQSPLRAIERHLMRSNIGYTIVRPNFFMENFSTGFLAPMIARGKISLAASDGKTSFISIEDIAEVVAALFLEKCCGTEYNITGPEALDYSQAAKIISDVTGKRVVYRAISEEEMIQRARIKGMPEQAARYLGMLYSAVRSGSMAVVTNDVRELTGRVPVSFADFARRNASRWSLKKAA